MAAQWPKDKPYKDAPTIDDLVKRTGLKISKLRELLRGVPNGRCPDNTVRYDADAAAAATEGVEPEDDSASEPLPVDPVQAALTVMNRTLGILSSGLGNLVKLQNDTIRQMGEPLKLGQDLVRENQALMRDRLKLYDDQQLDIFVLLEELHSRKDERERNKVRDAERSKLRGETMDLAKRYIPSALDKFQLTMEAQLALELLGSVDPDLLAGVAPTLLPEEMQSKVPKLVELLKRRAAVEAAAAAARKAKEDTSNGSTEPTPEAPSESAPASSSEPAN